MTNLQAAPPSLREQVSLNGEWPQGGKVPVYDSQNSAFKTRTYERQVTVPAAWKNKRVKLEFGAVNHFCEVFVDGQKVGQHNGAWIPFSFDITPWVKPGQTFSLRLGVRGKMVPPTVVDGQVVWWIGHNDLDDKRSGIVDDVWLRAYAPVHIEDAFIQTSTRRKALRVEYQVVNGTDAPWRGEILGMVQREKGAATEKQLRQSVLLAPRERKTVALEAAWNDATLWWPHDPQLYILKSRLSGAAGVDEEQRRFGFREFWTQGTQFRLNGVRVNLRGDWCAYSQYWGAIPTPEVLRRHYEGVLATNSNILRWHKHPAPKFAYDMADEMGLMILAESPVYARSYLKNIDHAAFIARCNELMPPMIKGLRNHPSIVMWSACNEMTFNFAGPYDPLLLKTLGDTINAHDPTRPVSYDGDPKVPGPVANFHYPEGYEKNPQGDSYTAWKKAQSPDRPTYYGEILAVRPGKNDNGWWIGIWPRGLRYQQVAGIAPRVYYAGSRISREQEELQRLAYHPNALFDITYDKLGIAPYKDNVLPELKAGETVTRPLALFNDDLRDERVRARVTLKIGGREFASGRLDVAVPVGEHRDLTATFQVPYAAGETLEVFYSTEKAGGQRFEEKKLFRIRETGQTGTSGREVRLELSAPQEVTSAPALPE